MDPIILFNYNMQVYDNGKVQLVVTIPFFLSEDTDLTKKLRKKGYNEYGKLLMTYNLDQNRFFILGFYIYTNDPKFRKHASNQEIYLLKGKGKVMLCNALVYMKSKGYGSDKSQVKLNASGGGSINVSIEQQKEIDKMTNDELNQFLSEYPLNHRQFKHYMQAYGIKEGTVEANENKKEYIGKILGNLKLVRYYEQTYGLKVSNKTDILNVKMKTTLKNILDHCRNY